MSYTGLNKPPFPLQDITEEACDHYVSRYKDLIEFWQKIKVAISKAKFKKGDVIFNKEMGAGLINSVNISQGTDETYGFSYEVLFTGTPSTDRCRTAILLESQLIPYNEMSQVLFKKD